MNKLDATIDLLLEKLYDLRHQAMVERSHYYVGNIVEQTIALLEDIRRDNRPLTKKVQP